MDCFFVVLKCRVCEIFRTFRFSRFLHVSFFKSSTFRFAGFIRKIKDRYKGKKIIFSLGRLVTYKGYEFLIAATKYLKDNYMILIGGTGALREKLQEEINSMHLRGKVKLLGHVSDEELPSYYGACDVFCLSSVQKTEAFGIVQIEAMSCGKPVVATKIPHSGVSWVNAHEESGINVVPGDAYALAKAIEAIAENGAAYDRYSEGALNRYQKLFTKEKMIAKCKELYDGLMKETKQ